MRLLTLWWAFWTSWVSRRRAWLATHMVGTTLTPQPQQQGCFFARQGFPAVIGCSTACLYASLMGQFTTLRPAGWVHDTLGSSWRHAFLAESLLVFGLFALSAGTFIAGMLARHHRKRVHTLCLIDPVCFGM